jgi:hypothetical protein
MEQSNYGIKIKSTNVISLFIICSYHNIDIKNVPALRHRGKMQAWPVQKAAGVA